MKILLTGGGTGGHITPILAVAHELKQLDPDCRTIYVGEKGGKFSELTANNAAIDESYAISAGKFRRYHGESWLRRIFDISTNLKNLCDVFRVIIGIYQAWRLLGELKPDVVFLKGGFVGVPIGLAAAARRFPIVTHDSDAIPGLANRLVSRWVSVHATALPATNYQYPPAKVRPVGVLVEHDYQSVSKYAQQGFKKQLGFNDDSTVLLITGGSSGAERINKAVVKIIDPLLAKYPNLQIIHQVGRGKSAVYENYRNDRLTILEFMKPMYVYTGAADLIVTRAGANAMAEFGVQGKACIVIPNPDLTGGHQLKNAEVLAEQGAAKVIFEEQLYDKQQGLQAVIVSLLDNEEGREQLARQLQKNTIVDAAQRLASLLVDQAKRPKV